MIDATIPVIVIAPYDRVFEKTMSNMREVAARDGRTILVTDPKGAREAAIDPVAILTLPDMAATATPLVYALPVQLLAYHTAVAMGTDVDQPRNLAKSVTVERPCDRSRSLHQACRSPLPHPYALWGGMR